MTTAARPLPQRIPPAQAVLRHTLPVAAPVALIGAQAGWFAAERDGDALLIRPTRPVERRCVIRPVALFDHGRFPGANTVMGRLLFLPGATEPQRYTPFTLDPQRRFRELLLLVEATPEDDLFSSVTRWRNHEQAAAMLLAAADVPWSGLTEQDREELATGEPWYQPLEGCVLHALAQWSAPRGRCVVEIGSLRGQSAAMLARALRGAGSRAHLVSIDPHSDQPLNRDHVRLALAAIGEDRRLVQIASTSDEAAGLLRPGSASLIFIDGDHAREQVAADFRNYRDALAPGGCLVFHDYGYGAHNGREDDVPGVRPAVDEYVMSDEEFRPVLLGHAMMAFVKR